MKAITQPGGLGLDDATQDYWQRYARKLANRMGLRDWRVTVSRNEPENPNHMASAQCTYGRRSIRIWLSKDFLSGSLQEQRWSMVHELCHAIMNPVTILALRNFENETKERHVLFYSLHQEAVEQAVDHFALVISERMPLPSTKKS